MNLNFVKNAWHYFHCININGDGKIAKILINALSVN